MALCQIWYILRKSLIYFSPQKKMLHSVSYRFGACWKFFIEQCCLWKLKKKASLFIYCFNCETYFITDFKIITDNETKLRLFRSSSQIGLRFHILIFPLKRRNVSQILNRWSLLGKLIIKFKPKPSNDTFLCLIYKL